MGQQIRVVTGFEGGDRSGYVYSSAYALVPLGPNVDLVPRLTLDYQFYSYDGALGTVSVRSPGVVAGAGIRVHAPGIAVTVGPAFEVRRTTRSTPAATTTFSQSGILLVGDLWASPGPRTTLTMGGSYSFANEYGRSSVSVMQRLTDPADDPPAMISAGAEAVLQGNPEAYFYGAGGVLGVGLPAERTTFHVRLGYMYYIAGETREGRPYLGIGVARGL